MQAIRYKWDMRDGPFLVLRNGDAISSMQLFGSEISAVVGERRCIGFFRDGRHFPCPHKSITPDRHCDECKAADDFFACVQCSGTCINNRERKRCMESRYALYLAAFGGVLKVGISQDGRLMERLV